MSALSIQDIKELSETSSSFTDEDMKAALDRERERKRKSKIYESRRTREFNPAWMINNPWLKYDEENNTMYCCYCRQEKERKIKTSTEGTTNFWSINAIAEGTSNFLRSKNAFADGTSNFRSDSVQCHKESSQHKKVMAAINKQCDVNQ